MQQRLNWETISSFYQRRPARFKAVQYEEGMIGLPDEIEHADYGDWFVLDIETGKTHVLPDGVFNLVFEEG